jgi:hypothetical protein
LNAGECRDRLVLAVALRRIDAERVRIGGGRPARAEDGAASVMVELHHALTTLKGW